jgi:hypothetical protein
MAGDCRNDHRVGVWRAAQVLNRLRRGNDVMQAKNPLTSDGLEQRLIHVRQLGVGPRQVGQVLLAARDQAQPAAAVSAAAPLSMPTHAARPAQRQHGARRGTGRGTLHKLA